MKVILCVELIQMQPPVPLPIIKNLKCAHCGKFVTCGPVFVTPDSSILCGRCQRFAKKLYRNLAFEVLAASYRYPCYYWPKHCNEKLSWNQSLDHEKGCLYQSGCNVFCSSPGTYFKTERKFPNITDIPLEHLKDEQIEQLKCIACESYLCNAPVFLLSDGKNVCHRCCHSNGPPQTAIRNLSYETIATAFVFPCIYRFRGCTVRMRFGRDMWRHEHDCAYGQITKPRLSKKPSEKGGKERGVIETHSGHIWGTITPHSALFAPPKVNKKTGKNVTQELEEVMRKKNHELDGRSFDAESMDSVMSKSTMDSLGDNISRSTADNISRSTGDNISRASSRGGDPRRLSNDGSRASGYAYAGDPSKLEKIHRSNADLGLNYPNATEVHPMPLPPGYNRVSSSGYYENNVTRYAELGQLQQYGHLAHYPPVFQGPNNGGLQPSGSFNAGVKRTESARVGNPDIINELRSRNKKHSGQKESNPFEQCNNLQDIVQIHDEVFK